MGRVKFLQWAAAQGWKHGQTYLNKAFNHFYDKGKLPDPKVILQKAKNYYDNFTGFTPKVVPKKGMFDNIFTKMHREVMGPPKVVKSSSPVTSVKEPVTSVREQALESFKGWKPTVIKGGKDGLATGGIANHFRSR